MLLSVSSLNESTAITRDIARSSNIASPFYSDGLLAIWEQVFEWKSAILHCDDCVLIGFRKKTALGEVFYSLPYGWYGGLIGSVSPANLASMSAWLNAQHFIEERIVQAPNGVATTFAKRYQPRELITHLLDLRQKLTYADNTTRNVKKSQSCGLSTRRLSLNDVTAIEELRQEHVARTGEQRRLSDAFYSALYLMTQSEDSGVTIVGVVQEERLLAAHIYFISESDVFYFDGYSTASGLELHANFFLFDTMINRSREFGRLRFNFGASPAGDTGLERFKTSWGAQPTVYHEYVHRSPIKRAVDLLRGRR